MWWGGLVVEEDEDDPYDDWEDDDDEEEEEDEETKEEEEDVVEREWDVVDGGEEDVVNPTQDAMGREVVESTVTTPYNHWTFPSAHNMHDTQTGVAFVPQRDTPLFHFRLRHSSQTMPSEVVMENGKKYRVNSFSLKSLEVAKDVDHDFTDNPNTSRVCGLCELEEL
jgi:hypothetical protein